MRKLLCIFISLFFISFNMISQEFEETNKLISTFLNRGNYILISDWNLDYYPKSSILCIEYNRSKWEGGIDKIYIYIKSLTNDKEICCYNFYLDKIYLDENYNLCIND